MINIIFLPIVYLDYLINVNKLIFEFLK